MLRGENIGEALVSVLTKKQPVNDSTGLRGQAAYVARQVGPLASKTVPIAQQAVPLAKNAGDSVRQGAESAIARATPLVESARHWAAPQLEQYAHAISESLAPMISSALISAAHKIDVEPPKRHRGRGILIGAMLLAVAGCVAAIFTMRRQQDYIEVSPPTPTDLGSVNASGQAGAEGQGSDGEGPDAEADGHPRIV